MDLGNEMDLGSEMSEDLVLWTNSSLSSAQGERKQSELVWTAMNANAK